MEAVVFKNVKKKLGDFTLDIPKLTIRKGYITGFVGENGAGKTTTIKLILGMLLANEGEIEVEGLKVSEKGEKIRQEIGYVGDPTGYPEESKLIDIKAMYAPFYKKWDDSLFDHYSQRFKLKLNNKYSQLSTGQKKQFALVMALSHRPSLIILDEPTAGLDPVVRNEILDVLMEHMQSDEVSIFYSTHITSDLEHAGDYLVYIKDGRIKMDIELAALTEEYCIVKAPKQLFDKEIKEEVLGYRMTQFGGEALMSSRKKAESLFGREAKYVTPTIEDIMVLLADKGGRE